MVEPQTSAALLLMMQVHFQLPLLQAGALVGAQAVLEDPEGQVACPLASLLADAAPHLCQRCWSLPYPLH